MNHPLVHRTCGETDRTCRCGEHVFRFGKFFGKTIDQVYHLDGGEGYLRWCLKNLDSFCRTKDFIDTYMARKGK